MDAFTTIMAHHFVSSLHLRSKIFYIYNHAVLIMFFSEIVPWALKPQIIHMLLLWGQPLLSIGALLVGGTWWISEHCSFHLLTTEIARGCWQVPDKHGLLHGSPWSTFSVAPWINHQLWQHALFSAFRTILVDVAAGGHESDYDLTEVYRAWIENLQIK